MGAAPIEVVLSARKPTFAAGESVLLDLAQVVRTNADLETLEMNRDRTTVRVVRLDGADEEERLTGIDHAKLHRVPLLQPIGRTMRLPAGTEFGTFVDLPRYRLPLAAGRYRIDLAYRWGAGADDVLRTNAVDVDVVAASPVSLHDRWFAAANPRDELATLYTATVGGSVRWMYRAAAGFDPAVVRMSCDLGPARPGASDPRIAHLNDIGAMHFQRWIVWMEGESVGFQKVSARGPLGEPMLVSHGLREAFLADPPLHRRDGGLVAVVVGEGAEGAAAAVLDVSADGGPSLRAVPMQGRRPRFAVVAWDDEDEDRPLAAVLHYAQPPDAAGISRVLRTGLTQSGTDTLLQSAGSVLALVAEQWLGQGSVFTLVREKDRFVTLRHELGGEAAAAAHHSEIPFQGSPPNPVDIACLGDGSGLVTLFRGASDWIVITPAGRFDLGFGAAPAPSTPRLVATRRGGVFLVFGDPAHGFLRAHVGA